MTQPPPLEKERDTYSRLSANSGVRVALYTLLLTLVAALFALLLVSPVSMFTNHSVNAQSVLEVLSEIVLGLTTVLSLILTVMMLLVQLKLGALGKQTKDVLNGRGAGSLSSADQESLEKARALYQRVADWTSNTILLLLIGVSLLGFHFNGIVGIILSIATVVAAFLFTRVPEMNHLLASRDLSITPRREI